MKKLNRSRAKKVAENSSQHLFEWDIFISHASEDKEPFVRELAETLGEKNVRVWYDDFTLRVGSRLRRSIDKGLANSRYGVVVLSPAFFSKELPQQELDGLASRERDGHDVILPVWLNVDAKYVSKYSPMMADRLAARADEGMETVVSDLLKVIRPGPSRRTPGILRKRRSQPEIRRKLSIPIGGTSLSLPCYFPGISSIKAHLQPSEYLRVIRSFNYPLFLISAYDMVKCGEADRESMKKMLLDAVNNQVAVILDSGNFESFWLKDETWTVERFHGCLRDCPYHFALCWDNDLQKMADGSATARRITVETERCVTIDQEQATRGTVLPIVHAPTALLPQVSYEVASRLRPAMICIPERELGDGILARAETTARIRRTLNRTGEYYPIHLLGTGDPLSMLVYVSAGADSFDGLDWWQSTVDTEKGQLHHFQNREFFGATSAYLPTGLPYTLETLAHNLHFYRTWMQDVQDSVTSGRTYELLEKYLPRGFAQMLRTRLDSDGVDH